eukprot:5038345-Amphidinium_carterae.1
MELPPCSLRCSTPDWSEAVKARRVPRKANLGSRRCALTPQTAQGKAIQNHPIADSLLYERHAARDEQKL